MPTHRQSTRGEGKSFRRFRFQNYNSIPSAPAVSYAPRMYCSPTCGAAIVLRSFPVAIVFSFRFRFAIAATSRDKTSCAHRKCLSVRKHFMSQTCRAGAWKRRGYFGKSSRLSFRVYGLGRKESPGVRLSRRRRPVGSTLPCLFRTTCQAEKGRDRSLNRDCQG